MTSGPIRAMPRDKLVARHDVVLASAWVNSHDTPTRATVGLWFQRGPVSGTSSHDCGVPLLGMLATDHHPVLECLLPHAIAGERVYLVVPGNWAGSAEFNRLRGCAKVLVRRVPEVPASGIQLSSTSTVWLGPRCSSPWPASTGWHGPRVRGGAIHPQPAGPGPHVRAHGLPQPAGMVPGVRGGAFESLSLGGWVMNKKLKTTLEEAGWKVGSVAEFLNLSPQEEVYVEIKLALSKALQERRKGLRLTQDQVANLLGSGQSRVAKMEKAEPSVSLDLMVRSLCALGASRSEVAKAIH